MHVVPYLVIPPVVPFIAAASVGNVTEWPIGLRVAIWLALAALVGTALGILREHTSSWPLPRVQPKRLARHGRRPRLRHA